MKEKYRIWGYIIGFSLIYILKVLWDYWWWDNVYFCLEGMFCFIITTIAQAIPVTPGEILIMTLLVWFVVWFVQK